MSVGGEQLEREGGMLKYRRMRPLRWSSFTSTASDESWGEVDDDIIGIFYVFMEGFGDLSVW